MEEANRAEQRMERQRLLTRQLHEAAKAYYMEDREIITNLEYDRLYDELAELEKETGIILAGSPTVMVGYEAAEELPKERHEKAMLSLDKTKDREALAEWLQDKKGLLSWKLDGLTVVLTYRDGKLEKAVTRGNGEVGEVVTANARMFRNLPMSIPFQGELILRGEAVIRYSDFMEINEAIEEGEMKYKNPRNLCSGSVRQLNNKVTAERRVHFYAFALVRAEGNSWTSREEQMLFLKQQGFEIVEYCPVDREQVVQAVGDFEQKTGDFDLPSDGLVLVYDDILYGESLGSTAKFPRDAIAFKWKDEWMETVLKEIEWSASRTGLINPVAIFEPVELEGTTVSRASVHNISILRALKLGIGDRITVYKANMIIPQIAENLTGSNTIEIPEHCPVCGGDTRISQINDVQSLYCTNPDCDAKKIKTFTLFVSRNGMNIEGLSEATLEKFIARGYIREYADLYHLEQFKEEIINMEGFGEKSFANLQKSIEASRTVSLSRLIYSLGIANIGTSNAKMICRYFGNDLKKMTEAEVSELSDMDGVGEVIASAFHDYFREETNRGRLERLLAELSLEQEETGGQPGGLSGMSFVVTGSLAHYASRNELKEVIESMGGKVTGSVTSKTICLINNDIASNSSKNKKAKELGVPILTEETFIEKYLGGQRNAD